MSQLIFDRLSDIQQTGVAILIIEHNIRTALAMSDRDTSWLTARTSWTAAHPACSTTLISDGYTSAEADLMRLTNKTGR